MKLTQAIALVLLQIDLMGAMPLTKRQTNQCQPLNLVGYWGQNSAGISSPNKADWEKPLASYCADSTYEYIYISFLNIFPSDARNSGAIKPPTLNVAFHCETTFDAQGFPLLLNCPTIGADIKTCQSNGKKILLSIGGATGPYGFSSDSEATAFASTFWNMFLGGSDDSLPRPFGDAVLDGVDLDIEAGSKTGYSTFITALRSKFATDSKQYFIGGAPQCVFPDAYLGYALDSAWFDLVTIQFYNNYCGVNNPTSFNYKVWADWAATKSVNPNVKLYVGVPSSPQAAGSGYVTIDALQKIVSDLATTQSNNFGGVMLWEVSLAEKNLVAEGNYATAIKAYLDTLCNDGNTPVVIPPVPSRSTAVLFHTTSDVAFTTEPVVTTDLPSLTLTVNPVFSTALPSLTNNPAGPTPTGTPINAPVNGGSCTDADQLGACAGTQYAQCVFGKWLVRDCSPGTVCKNLASGGFICDWA